MIEEQKLGLPFDDGLGPGLAVYLKRLAVWAQYALWNSVIFAALYLIANRDRVGLSPTDIMFCWLLRPLLLALTLFYNRRTNGTGTRFSTVLIIVSGPMLLIALCGVFLLRPEHSLRTAGC